MKLEEILNKVRKKPDEIKSYGSYSFYTFNFDSQQFIYVNDVRVRCDELLVSNGGLTFLKNGNTIAETDNLNDVEFLYQIIK